ncbi:MAG TPA: hypothetical protein VFD30_20460 [Terriglobia bacterium]|nr:hypothetical protein [Terriglobia bacterium]
MKQQSTPTTNCERCGALIQLSPTRNPESKPFRLAAVPKGVCADCVMTQFLYNTYPINMQIDEAGPELLLKPGITDAFVMCGLLEGCDLKIEEINWRRVVANWNLPVKVKRDGRNPYRMGEAPKARLRRKDLTPEEREVAEFEALPFDQQQKKREELEKELLELLPKVFGGRVQ